MAKIVYLGASGDLQDIGENFGNASGAFSTQTKTSATWVDAQTGSQKTIEGTKLKFESGVLFSGDVTNILVEDVEDADVGKFTGHFNAQQLGRCEEHGR